MAELCLLPGQQFGWRDFCSPRFLEGLEPHIQEIAATHGIVAVDGLVRATRDDIGKRRFAVDHHQSGRHALSRFDLPSSSQQLYLRLNSGLRELLTVDGTYNVVIAADHPDPDVAACYFVADNIERFDDLDTVQSTRLNALLRIIDFMDITSGSFQTKHDREIFHAQATILRPYMASAREGLLKRKDPAEYEEVVRQIGSRMNRYVMLGDIDEYELDLRYDEMGGGPGWQMIREVGEYGRYEAFRRNRGLICASELGWNEEIQKEMWLYSILCKGPYHPTFRPPELYAKFNEREEQLLGRKLTENNRWGGSSHSGGSPKLTGSAIQPDELIALTNETIS